MQSGLHGVHPRLIRECAGTSAAVDLNLRRITAGQRIGIDSRIWDRIVPGPGLRSLGRDGIACGEVASRPPQAVARGEDHRDPDLAINTTSTFHCEDHNPLWRCSRQREVQWSSLRTVSQMCHAFAEPGGHGRTPEDTKATEVEYRRTLEEPAGYGRTRDTAGSGP